MPNGMLLAPMKHPRPGQLGSVDLGSSFAFCEINYPWPSDMICVHTTGIEILTLPGSDNNGREVDFSPDGTYLAVTSGSGLVRIYVLPVEDLLALAQARVERGMTDGECRQYLHLDACPVDAFSSEGYRVDQCVEYLRSDQKSACREMGCAARRSCPVGRAFSYEADHAQFHMAAFLKSRLLKG